MTLKVYEYLGENLANRDNQQATRAWNWNIFYCIVIYFSSSLRVSTTGKAWVLDKFIDANLMLKVQSTPT